MLRMDQVHVIRHKVLREGASIRQVALELGLSRNTVSKYLEQSVPVRRTYRRRQRPVWSRVQSRLEELVAEWEPRTTAKQRLTGVRLYRALVEEGYQVGLTMIYQYLRERRRQRAEVYVPLIHRAGDEAQVDFFEVTVELDGQRHKAWKFLLRLITRAASSSGCINAATPSPFSMVTCAPLPTWAEFHAAASSIICRRQCAGSLA